jgi:hypothetical protein
MKKIKKKLIKYFAQKYADILIMQLEQYKSDEFMFYQVYERACLLNNYCIVFHDIYLD